MLGLRTEYTRRRDFFVDCIAENFHLELAPPEKNGIKGSEMYLASHLKVLGEKRIRKSLFSFVPPSSGMFVWVSFAIFYLYVYMLISIMNSCSSSSIATPN